MTQVKHCSLATWCKCKLGIAQVQSRIPLGGRSSLLYMCAHICLPFLKHLINCDGDGANAFVPSQTLKCFFMINLLGGHFLYLLRTTFHMLPASGISSLCFTCLNESMSNTRGNRRFRFQNLNYYQWNLIWRFFGNKGFYACAYRNSNFIENICHVSDTKMHQFIEIENYWIPCLRNHFQITIAPLHDVKFRLNSSLLF